MHKDRLSWVWREFAGRLNKKGPLIQVETRLKTVCRDTSQGEVHTDAIDGIYTKQTCMCSYENFKSKHVETRISVTVTSITLECVMRVIWPRFLHLMSCPCVCIPIRTLLSIARRKGAKHFRFHRPAPQRYKQMPLSQQWLGPTLSLIIINQVPCCIICGACSNLSFWVRIWMRSWTPRGNCVWTAQLNLNAPEIYSECLSCFPVFCLCVSLNSIGLRRRFVCFSRFSLCAFAHWRREMKCDETKKTVSLHQDL